MIDNKVVEQINKGFVKCCNKDWGFKPMQTLQTDEEVWEGVCLECGGFIKIVSGQLDEEEIEAFED